jgi:prophage regulatory protein
MHDAVLRLKKVLEITGLGRATLYRRISQGEFPRPVKPTETARGWRQSEIQSWIDKLERDDAPVGKPTIAGKPTITTIEHA